MPAQLTIDQAGLPAGTAGESRSDGLATGALVTLTSSGGGSTHLFELLWVPDADTTAVGSLTPVSDVATFSPTVAVFGTYRIRLTIDQGLPTEDVTVRTFSIRTIDQALRIPALNERGDPRANLLVRAAAQIANSEDNEPDGSGPFLLGNYSGWYRALRALYLAQEAKGAGGAAALFNWNGVDVTQFGSNLFTPTAGTAVLGVNTSFPERNYLEIVLTGFQGRCMFPVSISNMPGRYVVIVHEAEQTGGFAGGDTPRFALYSNLLAGASYLGLEISRPFGASNADLIQEEGTTQIATQGGNLIAASIANNRRRGSLDEYQLLFENPVVTDPDLIMAGKAFSQSGRAGENWDTGGVGPFTGWDTLTPAGIGLGARFTNVQTGTIRFGQLTVLPHPADL